MKITELRNKKNNKKKELDSISKELKAIPTRNYLILASVLILITVLLTVIIFNYKTSKSLGFDNTVSYKNAANCAKSLNCVDSCLTFYSADVDVNHTLECRYKCLEYKYCDE